MAAASYLFSAGIHHDTVAGMVFAMILASVSVSFLTDRSKSRLQGRAHPEGV